MLTFTTLFAGTVLTCAKDCVSVSLPRLPILEDMHASKTTTLARNRHYPRNVLLWDMYDDVRTFVLPDVSFEMIALKERNEILVGDEGDVEGWLSANVAVPLFRLTGGKHRLAKRTVCGKRKRDSPDGAQVVTVKANVVGQPDSVAGLENQMFAPVEVKPPWGLELKGEEVHVNWPVWQQKKFEKSQSTEEQDDTSKPMKNKWANRMRPFAQTFGYMVDNKVRCTDCRSHNFVSSHVLCVLACEGSIRCPHHLQ